MNKMLPKDDTLKRIRALVLAISDPTVSWALGALTIALAVVFEEKRIRGLRSQNRKLERIKEDTEVSRRASEQTLEHARTESYAKLHTLDPAFRAAISEYCIRAFVEIGESLTPVRFFEWLHNHDPALEEAWSTVTRARTERTRLISDVLDSIRRAKGLGKSGVSIGKTFIPCGKPVPVLSEGHGYTPSLLAKIGGARWNEGARLVAFMFLFISGFVLLLGVAQLLAYAGLGILLAPVLVAGLTWWFLRSARETLKEELSHISEFGVYFEPGEIGPTATYVSFGEYSGANYYRPATVEEAQTFAKLGASPWKRFSPNGLAALGSAVDGDWRPELMFAVKPPDGG